jgi:protein AaeX
VSAAEAARPPFRRGRTMNFTEVDVLGVYVAPISVMLVAAWIVLVAIRRIADRARLLRYVWHPALFVFSLYVTILSCFVLLVAW